jgi:hypothetical protein
MAVRLSALLPGRFSAYTICQYRFGVRLLLSHVLVFLRHYFFHTAVMKCAVDDVGLYKDTCIGSIDMWHNHIRVYARPSFRLLPVNQSKDFT